MQFGFISAGGGTWYTGTLQLLNPGDRVWVKAPGHGFVGVARVTGTAKPAAVFKVQTLNGEVPVLDVAIKGKYHRAETEENCEHFVPVKWLQTVPLDKAIHEVGLFGHQHSVCKPRTPKWRNTVERLKLKFPEYDAAF
ncbi:MAG: hypothetical protein IT425_01165 [Pirellulales bacterium]|nr:hypothetical protein [Pirellulales bacterium]